MRARMSGNPWLGLITTACRQYMRSPQLELDSRLGLLDVLIGLTVLHGSVNSGKTISHGWWLSAICCIQASLSVNAGRPPQQSHAALTQR